MQNKEFWEDSENGGWGRTNSLSHCNINTHTRHGRRCLRGVTSETLNYTQICVLSYVYIQLLYSGLAVRIPTELVFRSLYSWTEVYYSRFTFWRYPVRLFIDLPTKV